MQASDTLATFVACMMLYPDAQKRCQDQLDEVIGPDRLPQFTDRDSLPLLECTLKETFRSV